MAGAHSLNQGTSQGTAQQLRITDSQLIKVLQVSHVQIASILAPTEAQRSDHNFRRLGAWRWWHLKSCLGRVKKAGSGTIGCSASSRSAYMRRISALNATCERIFLQFSMGMQAARAQAGFGSKLTFEKACLPNRSCCLQTFSK